MIIEPDLNAGQIWCTLTPAEVSLCKALGKARNAAWVDRPEKNRRYANQTDIDINFIGVRAEYAVATVWDVPLANPLLTRQDPGYDLIYQGVTYDVKSNSLGIACLRKPIRVRAQGVIFCAHRLDVTGRVLILGGISLARFKEYSEPQDENWQVISERYLETLTVRYRPAPV